ncbi:MAG: PD-(D/E)XK nuclease family protein, partial [Lautropia sp.]
GGAQPADDGWAGRFERARELLELIDTIEVARAVDWLGAGAVGEPLLSDAASFQAALEHLLAPLADGFAPADRRLLVAAASAIAEPDDPVRIAALRWRTLLNDWRAAGALVVRVGLRALQHDDGAVATVGDRVLLAMRRATPALPIVDLHPAGAAQWGEGGRIVAAAWPEIAGSGTACAPIGARALAAADRPRVAAMIMHARSREDEAQLAAQWVHRVLAEGRRHVAIVVFDRWLARRVRALLERSAILIDDREGWALSTTVAASWPMAWLDYCRALVDGERRGLAAANAATTLLDSAFTAHPAAAPLAAAIRRQGRDRDPRAAAAPVAGDAGALDRELTRLALRQRAATTLREQRDALAAVLTLLGTDAALRADEAGRQVLALLEALPPQANAACRLEPFRALLGMAFERRRFHDAGIVSPVTMIGLEAALAERHDAVLLLGANDGRLPAAPAPPPGVSEPMLPLLGLPPVEQLRFEQTLALAWLLAGTASAAFTCSTTPSDGSLPSPLVERLAAVAGFELEQLHSRLPWRELDTASTTAAVSSAPGGAGSGAADADRWPMPRPAAAIGALPATLPVGAIERLIGCPFEFLVRDVWRLSEFEDPSEAPARRELGILVHDVLRRFHEQVPDPNPHSDDALVELLAELTDRAVVAAPALRAGRLVELREWLGQLPAYVARFREDHRDGWRFVAAEQPVELVVGYRAGAAPAQRTLLIHGIYDRLDRRDDALRIVDYKLRAPDDVKRLAKDPDRAAQLMLYSWSVGAGDAVYLQIHRRSLALVALTPAPQSGLPAWRERLGDALARLGDGEPLRALGGHCERCAARGVCRQGHWHERAAELTSGSGA